MSKNPPKAQRAKQAPPVIPTAVFTYKVEWQLQPDVLVYSSFKLQLPPQFGNKNNIFKFAVNGNEGTQTQTSNLVLTDQIVQQILSSPFLFKLSIPDEAPQPVNNKFHSKSSRNAEKFIEGYIQIDGHNLCYAENIDTSYTCHAGPFAKVTFTISVQEPLLNQQMIRLHKPIFIRLIKVENMPNSPTSFEELSSVYAPVYFKCVCNGEINYIAPQMHQSNHYLNAIIIKIPRMQLDLTFEVHDRDKILPETTNYIGNSFIEPFVPVSKRKGLYLDTDEIIKPNPAIPNPYGGCNFKILPERRSRAPILPIINHKSPIQAGNFHASLTDLSFITYDPYSALPPLEEQSSPPPVKVPPAKVQGKKRDLFEQSETNETEYFRWLLVARRDNQSENYAKMLDCLIVEHHKAVLNEHSESVLQTFTYNTGTKRNLDLITGFHLTTPNEHIIIAESRVQAPNQSLQKLQQFFTARPPIGVRIFFGDRKFPSPREYSTLSTIYQKIEVPVNILDFVKVEALYFHSSVIHVLYDVIQKLTAILQSPTYDYINQNDLYPSVPQLNQLISQAASLPSFMTKEKKKEVSAVPKVSIKTSSRSLSNSARPAMNAILENRPRFVNFGRPKTVMQRAPNRRIGVSQNGEEELWLVDDPETLKEEGWTIEILKRPASTRHHRPKTQIVKRK